MDELVGARVLVVDDERDTLDVIEMLLRTHGAETRAASSAADGMACLTSFRPEVLVSDLAMPGEDGLTFIRRVRQLPADKGGRVPAVALSAHVYKEDQERALSAGFDAFVPKPVRPRALIDCVRALLARARAFVDRRRGERRRGGAGETREERRRLQRRQFQTC
jgi:CheY-like chemotaxis protein